VPARALSKIAVASIVGAAAAIGLVEAVVRQPAAES
jgi:hypothetical protein